MANDAEHLFICSWALCMTSLEKWGEGFSGTTIKDIWTKPRGSVEAGEGGGFGWGGVEGWGENAVNCN